MAFSVCFVFMVLLIAVNYASLHRLSSSLQFSEISEELNSTILEMRRYEKNFFLFHDIRDIEENISYTNRLNLLLSREKESLIKSIGKDHYLRFLKYEQDYSSFMEALRDSSGEGAPSNKLQSEIRKTGQDLLVFADQLVGNERRAIKDLLRHMGSFPIINLIALVILLAFVVIFIGEKMVRPLARITREAEAISQDIYHAKISPFGNSKNEIHHLITAINRMMHELENRQEQLVQSRKIAAVGTLTSGIAHEINNPINNLSLTLESLMQDDGTIEPDERRQRYQEALDQVERASDSVKNLLEFSRASHPRMEDADLEEVVDKAVRILNNELKMNNVRLLKEIGGSLPALRLDKGGIQQVFINLFINAMHAMPHGGKLRVTMQRAGDVVKIDVTDTGTGISPENLKRIFEPFFTTKKEGEGTGLGLYVSYLIIKKHGGTIQVHSSSGAGTTFSISLPIGMAA